MKKGLQFLFLLLVTSFECHYVSAQKVPWPFVGRKEYRRVLSELNYLRRDTTKKSHQIILLNKIIAKFPTPSVPGLDKIKNDSIFFDNITKLVEKTEKLENAYRFYIRNKLQKLQKKFGPDVLIGTDSSLVLHIKLSEGIFKFPTGEFEPSFINNEVLDKIMNVLKDDDSMKFFVEGNTDIQKYEKMVNTCLKDN